MQKTVQTISYAILKLLEGSAASAIDIAWAMMTTKQESSHRFWKLRYNTQESIGNKIVRTLKTEHAEYKRYHALLGKLRKQGLVTDEGIRRDKQWLITKRGIAFLKSSSIKTRSENITALTQADGLTIISYDIPEKIRRERNKIRELLIMMNFQQIQKSVWFGNKKVTKSFIDILREKKILNFVHIFEINKTGTIKNSNVKRLNQS